MAKPQMEFAALANQMAAAPTPAAANLIAQRSASVKLPQTATLADQQIMQGLTMLLAALAAAGGFAIWRRRLRGLVISGGH
jgi:Ca-activated chloride channel family protein